MINLKIISTIELFKGHKWIPGEILDYKHLLICLDKLTILNPNDPKMANLTE